MIIYLDTSALIKRYVREPGSDELNSLLSRATLTGTSIITWAEMAAATAKAQRMSFITAVQAQSAWKKFRNDWISLALIEISKPLVIRAGDLAWDHGLRGYDSVHLASALMWQEALGEQIRLAAFDHRLWETGRKVGLLIWPERLGED